MANFNTAFANTMAFEGGFVNDPDDEGGETAFGISRKAFPNLYLWTMLDRNPEYVSELKKFKNWDDINSRTERIIWWDLVQKDIEGTYYQDFWTPLRASEIQSQEIANYLFDFAVNSGHGDAVKALQGAINDSVKREVQEHISVDGIIGDETICAANDLGIRLESIMPEFRLNRLLHYAKQIARKPANLKFARGWFRRALTA